MNDRPYHLEAGRQLLELQLAMMKSAMTLMADSAQRFVELSQGTATGTRGAVARPQGSARTASAAVPAQRQRGEEPGTVPAKATRLVLGSKDYALRMQQDVDSILHAFAMVPDAADRLIRTSALLTDKPGKGTEPRARPPGTPAPAPRRAPREAAEHAR